MASTSGNRNYGKVRGVVTAMHRWWYLVATYFGIRALAHRASSPFYARHARLAQIHGTLLSSDTLGDLVVAVHFRECPLSGGEEASYGVISVRQQRPRLSRLLYWYFCLTSHFGVGHLEIAFYEKDGKITFYAVRNLARSNALRLGFKRIADKLLLIPHDEEFRLILEVSSLLETHGWMIEFARSEECVRLSVCVRLLKPAAQERTLFALQNKYERLCEKFGQRKLNEVAAGS